MAYHLSGNRILSEFDSDFVFLGFEIPKDIVVVVLSNQFNPSLVLYFLGL